MNDAAEWQIIFETLGAVASLVAIIGIPLSIAKFIGQRRVRTGQGTVVKTKGVRDNLPPLGLVIGRKHKAEELLKKVNSNHMLLIQGVGGIGKTTLSIYIARKYKRRKRANIIWVTSKNEILTLDKILNSIAHFFDFTGIDSLELDAKRDKILQVLKHNRSLLIVDNFETIEDDTEIKAFLNSISSNCKILITSRNNTVVSPNQVTLQIDTLTNKNAILLMRKELEKYGRPELAMEDYKKLLVAIGGSPLAIKWVIGQITTNGHTVDTICSQLREGVVAGSIELFENIFEMAWQELNDIQKDILYLLQFFVTPVSAKALWKLSGLADETQFACELGKLLQLSLVDSNLESNIEKRFLSLHSLTNSFISTELKKEVNNDCRIARRILANYKTFCLERCTLPHGRQKDYGDIEREWQNIDKSIKYSIQNLTRMEDQAEIENNVLEISKAINVFLWSRGYWQERIEVCKRAYEIARNLNRNEEAGQFACFIGIVLFWQSKNEESELWVTLAEELLSNSARIKRVLAERLRGLTQLGNQRFDNAINTLKSVFEVISSESEEVTHDDVAIIADWVAASREGYKAGRVSLLQEIGICYNRKGEYDNAIAYLRHSESLARSIEDDEGLSISLSHLGHSLFGLGKYKEAKTAYKEGLRIALLVGRKSTIARCYEGLTKIAKKQRNIILMFVNGGKALALFERLNMQQELDDIKNIMAIKII